MSVSYADPAVLDRVRYCLKKKRYNTEERAWQIAMKIYRRYGDLQGAFECSYCEGWHCGHPKSPMRQAELRLMSQSW